MTAIPTPKSEPSKAEADWSAIATRAPQMAQTIGRYLDQIGTTLAPTSVAAAENALRQFALWLIDSTDVRAVSSIDRTTVEDYKVWLATQPGHKPGTVLSANTHRQRLRTIRAFFERIIEWDWADTPPRNPVIAGDLPPRPEPLPKFLDDRAAAKIMAAARAATDPRDRLVVELLARTGLRAGEMCELAADAVMRIGDGHWLRVPVGKLRNDRIVPLHPQLVELLAEWTATNLDHIRSHRLLVADHRGSVDRHQVWRIVRRVAKSAGVEAHPHQLRHTLATQAINRGMRLEAIATLLGHRSMEMTLVYARIADRVVADEYEAISKKVDALYGQELELPANLETTAMAKLRREAHARMLGNGLCTRPVELDCRMESACETCSYFQTSIEFKPTLQRQRDHASEHGQSERVDLFDRLLLHVDAQDG
jgi:site-specific recombinase XerD